MTKEQQKEQPPPLQNRFVVGKDSEGYWVMSDSKGSIGGLFVSRAAALHYAVTESEHKADSVFCARKGAVVRLGAANDDAFVKARRFRRAIDVSTVPH